MKKIISSIKKKITPNLNPMSDKYMHEGRDVIIKDSSFKYFKIYGALWSVTNLLIIICPSINLIFLLVLFNVVFGGLFVLCCVELIGKTQLKKNINNNGVIV